MSVQLLTEHHLEFRSLRGDYTGSSESTLVKMPHGWKSHVAAQMFSLTSQFLRFKNIKIKVFEENDVLGDFFII